MKRKQIRAVGVHETRAEHPEMATEFLRMCTKYGLEQIQLQAFLQSSTELHPGTIRNFVNDVWGGAPARKSLSRLANFLAHNIPYDISPSDYEDHLRLRGSDPLAKTIASSKIRALEGVYELTRYHSDSPNLLKEYITLFAGKIGYYNYKFGAKNSVIIATITAERDHIFFSSDKSANPGSNLAAMVEFNSFGGNSFAGMIFGLSDEGMEMVCCRMTIRKISHVATRIDDFAGREPHVSTLQDRRVRRALDAKLHDIVEHDNIYRFSGRMMRRSSIKKD